MNRGWPEAATGGVLYKKVFLKILQNSQENTCARVSFLIKLLLNLFSCEFYEIFKDTFFTDGTRLLIDRWIVYRELAQPIQTASKKKTGNINLINSSNIYGTSP